MTGVAAKFYQVHKELEDGEDKYCYFDFISDQ